MYTTPYKYNSTCISMDGWLGFNGILSMHSGYIMPEEV